MGTSMNCKQWIQVTPPPSLILHFSIETERHHIQPLTNHPSLPSPPPTPPSFPPPPSLHLHFSPSTPYPPIPHPPLLTLHSHPPLLTLHSSSSTPHPTLSPSTPHPPLLTLHSSPSTLTLHSSPERYGDQAGFFYLPFAPHAFHLPHFGVPVGECVHNMEDGPLLKTQLTAD